MDTRTHLVYCAKNRRCQNTDCLSFLFSKQQIPLGHSRGFEWFIFKKQSEERCLLYGNEQTQHYAREIQTRKVESLTNEQQKRTRSVIHSRWYFWRINIHYENWGTKILIPRLAFLLMRTGRSLNIDWCAFWKSYRKYTIHQRVLSRRNTQCFNLTKRPREPTCAAECNSRAMKTEERDVSRYWCSFCLTTVLGGRVSISKQFSPVQSRGASRYEHRYDNHKQFVLKMLNRSCNRDDKNLCNSS